MKYLAIALTLFLAACATPVDTATITARAKQIQDYTRLACSFVPTIGTIANILSSGTAGPAIAIANDICTAVTTAPLADGPRRGPPHVRGVIIKGRFVR